MLEYFSNLLLSLLINAVPSNDGYEFIHIVEHFLVFFEQNIGDFLKLFLVIKNPFRF